MLRRSKDWRFIREVLNCQPRRLAKRASRFSSGCGLLVLDRFTAKTMRPILVNGLIAALGAFALSPIDGAVAAQVPSVGPKHPGAEVIEGLVTTDSGSAIQGADVIATRAPDRAFKATKTDSAGRFRIIFDESSGDYLVHAAAVGREAARKRVTRVGS